MICERCGEPIEDGRRNKRFCSVRCRVASHRAGVKLPPRLTIKQIAKMQQISERLLYKTIFITKHVDEETIQRIKDGKLKIDYVYNEVRRRLRTGPPFGR